MSETPVLIVGLGNPGPEHERDRHNAGFWLVDSLAAACGMTFRDEKKLQGYACQVTVAGETIRLLKPHTFMNRSGSSVRRAMDFYKLKPEQILIVHDDLDLPPGVARFKKGGGHGGNNGLRDVIANCGKDFLRLRIGIGHPGDREKVVGYVLRPPGRDELTRIEEAIREAERALETLVTGGLERATTQLHTATARPDDTLTLGSAG
jgi:PTH1 family peptidyl-tRNA hydrolase